MAATSMPCPESPSTTLEYGPTPLFDEMTAEALDFLDTEGYVVIKDILTPEEIETAEDLMWSFLEGIPGYEIFRGDWNTWKSWPGKFYDSGVMTEHGIGNSDFLWFLRTRPTVLQAFQRIWNTELLLTSFDGANAFRPYHNVPGWKTRGGWFHCDQNDKVLSGKACIQGLVNLTAVTPQSGGLVVMPRTHGWHKKLCNGVRGTGHFVKVPKKHKILTEMNAKLVTCPPGCLCLWDSRTVHCNTPGLLPETTPSNQLKRMVGYVCMLPDATATKELLAAKVHCYNTHCTCTHWPTHAIVSGYGGSACKERAVQDADPLVQQLVGWTRLVELEADTCLAPE